jgi:hypothetical protein
LIKYNFRKGFGCVFRGSGGSPPAERRSQDCRLGTLRHADLINRSDTRPIPRSDTRIMDLTKTYSQALDR